MASEAKGPTMQPGETARMFVTRVLACSAAVDGAITWGEAGALICLAGRESEDPTWHPSDDGLSAATLLCD